MRAQLELIRDSYIDSSKLADMTNSQLATVVEGFDAVINAAEELAPPAAVIEVASLTAIKEALLDALSKCLVAPKSRQKAPGKRTTKARGPRKTLKKR
jgi:putative NADH-flavin reductase